MLNVQEYLRTPGNTLETLHNELGIEIAEHPIDPLVILNYSQIDSPKTNPIVMECRALVLEKDTWNIVAKAFNRFFNWGEVTELMDEFDWNGFVATVKEDGSLILVYNYGGKWRINTRGSFAQSLMNDTDITWEQHVKNVWDKQNIGWMVDLPTDLTFVFELCTQENKVVRFYKEPKLALLSIFAVSPDDAFELSNGAMMDISDTHRMKRTEQLNFTAMYQIEDYLKYLEDNDPTNEGVVIRDQYNHRWKLKNKKYLTLHKMWTNGNITPKTLMPWVLSGDADELLTYFPEVKSLYNEVQYKVWDAFAELTKLWLETYEIPVQKDFALAIIKRTRFTSLLFTVRKEAEREQRRQTLQDLEKLWRDSGDMILKILFDIG